MVAGDTLGKSGDSVRSAFKSTGKQLIEKAVDKGRISRSRADKVESKIDSSDCWMPMPPRGGCGPPPPGS